MRIARSAVGVPADRPSMSLGRVPPAAPCRRRGLRVPGFEQDRRLRRFTRRTQPARAAPRRIGGRLLRRRKYRATGRVTPDQASIERTQTERVLARPGTTSKGGRARQAVPGRGSCWGGRRVRRLRCARCASTQPRAARRRHRADATPRIQKVLVWPALHANATRHDGAELAAHLGCAPMQGVMSCPATPTPRTDSILSTPTSR